MKKSILKTLIAFAIFHFAFGCGSGSRIRPVKQFVTDAAGHYSFVAPLKRFCDDRRSDFRLYNVEIDEDTSDCKHLVPGLSKLTRGVTRYHFRSNARDKAPMHSQIFRLTCYDSLSSSHRKFQNHTVPTEISIIESRPVTTHQQYTISTTSLLDSFLDDIELMKAQNSYIPYLATLNITEVKNFKGAGYFSVTSDLYFARLKTNIKPKPLLQEEFNALPLTLESNVFEYYSFIRKWGSHAIFQSTFGGQVFALHLHNGADDTKMDSKVFKSPDDLLKAVENLKAGDSSRLTILTIGGRGHNVDLYTWISTIKDDPVPLTREYMPLQDLIEKNSKTVKSHFFQKMIKFEKDEYELKRLLFELNVVKKNNKLGEFLKKTLVGELDHICVSPDLMSMLFSGVTKAKNIKLNKLGLNCTLRYPEGPDEHHVERQYNLIPNVCLTFHDPTPNGCYSMSYLFPDGIKCLVFYEEPNCNPESTKQYVRNEFEINKHFPRTKSMKLCTTKEG